jgi:hypothetical protein
MTKLSPDAQVVLEAANGAQSYGSDDCLNESRWIAAAALRAAAEIVAPLSYEDAWTDGKMLQYEKYDPVREKLLAIADGLEGLSET